jgi:hypothetical protein
MNLLPSQQSETQRKALLLFLEQGRIRLQEPCDCGSTVRHNNGGNYHAVVDIRMDGGKVWRTETFTGDYGSPDDWREVAWAEALEEIASRAAEGWAVSAPP